MSNGGRVLLGTLAIVFFTAATVALGVWRDSELRANAPALAGFVATDKPVDMCMASARFNRLEGEVYADDTVDAPGDDGCVLYTCSIIDDRDHVRRSYTVEDCGPVVRSNP